MKNIRAIFYNISLKDFVSFCDKNEINIHKWIEDSSKHICEIRVDLYNLDEYKLGILEDYLDSDEFMNYDYVIIWE